MIDLGPWTVDGRPASVPGVYAAAPLTSRALFAGRRATWRTTFTTDAGRYAISFASVSHRARVSVDGRPVCSHTGAYEPFRCAADLGAGEHALTVAVDWRHPERQERTGYDRAWFNWGGVNGPVTVAPDVPRPRLTRIVTTLLRDGSARVTLTVRPRPQACRFDRARGVQTDTPFVVSRPRLWSPADPHRYELTCDGGPTARVGLRELRTDHGRLLLNGRPLQLRGAGLPADAQGHGDAFTARDEDRIVAELRAVNANAARAQQPLSDSLLDRLDQAGILVWQVLPPFDKAGRFWATTAQRRRAAAARALAAADRVAVHPSIAVLSLANEVSGNGRRPAQPRYVDDLAQRLKGRGALVAVDVWGSHLPNHRGPLYRHLDLVGLTEYIGLFEGAGESRAQLDDRAAHKLARLRRALPGLPVVISEFGANANRLNRDPRVGSYAYQARLLADRIAFYRRHRVPGMLIWVLRDYAVAPDFFSGTLRGVVPGLRVGPALNEKGLFRYDGSAKPAVAAVRRAYR